ncbi:outer membrane protein [Pseudorhodoplanes sp.]|uniref:outer membrane protein n=1 Tax=Pseudorhodoplanes sp. TaxID=1934341 RepID=UPI002CD83A3E|nr:outer membrane protein [Pseudorhodoplanes sp.]HWV51133.1 outer membrane protein [Pseudorhodoplanes sp.]
MKKFLSVAVAAFAMTGTASAADIASPVYKAPVAAPAYSWTGFYIGGHVGYGWGEAAATPTGIVGLIADPFRFNTNGFMGGATVGYNYQYGNIVIGTEGEIAWSDIDGSGGGNLLFGLGGSTLTGTYQNKWNANVSTRIGVAFNTVLVYGKAGVAWANNDYSVTASIPAAPFAYASTISETETGWIVGGGVEWAFAGNWTMKIEGTYMDFGQKNRAFTPVPIVPGFALPVNADIDSHISTIKFGVNYRF